MLRFSLALAFMVAPIVLPATQKTDEAPAFSLPRDSQQPKGNRLPLLRRLIETGKWTELGRQVAQGIGKHDISLRDLQMLSLSFPDTPFFHAVLATKNILSLKEKTGLSLRTIFPIALFAETTMNKEVRKGKKFWDDHRFGRELQYDKQHHNLFIHLGTRGVKPVGIGRMKVVTKTVLYDRLKPEVMARGVSEANCHREMYAMSKLKGIPNVLEAQALMRHKDPKSGKKLATIVTRIIRPGSLHNILEKKSWNLTLKERLKIACDIMHGIAGMQEKGFVHRDLGAKNYFVRIKGSKPGHRKIVAYVADFGRTMPFKQAKDVPVQGNSRYAPPEAIYREKMHGKQYCNSDLFAIGCVFWQLYFGKLPPWSESEYFKNESIAQKHRYRAKVFHINAIRKQMADKYVPKLKKHQKFTPKQGFLQIILKMTDPNPENRGTAKELYGALHTLVYGKPPSVPENMKNDPNGHKHGSNRSKKAANASQK